MQLLENWLWRLRSPSKPYVGVYRYDIDACIFSNMDQSIVSRHKWSHLRKLPLCRGLNANGTQCEHRSVAFARNTERASMAVMHRYHRVDTYNSDWLMLPGPLERVLQGARRYEHYYFVFF